MRPHREARAAHDKQIAKVENELALNVGKIQTERATEEKLENQFKDLGDRAAKDDRGALRKQRELAPDLESTRLQIRNLAKRGEEIRQNLAELQSARPKVCRCGNRGKSKVGTSRLPRDSLGSVRNNRSGSRKVPRS